MKIFVVEFQWKNGDSYLDYLGTDKEAAAAVFENEKDGFLKSSYRERQTRRFDLRFLAYEIPDMKLSTQTLMENDHDALNSDPDEVNAVLDAIGVCGGADVIDAFDSTAPIIEPSEEEDFFLSV